MRMQAGHEGAYSTASLLKDNSTPPVPLSAVATTAILTLCALRWSEHSYVVRGGELNIYTKCSCASCEQQCYRGQPKAKGSADHVKLVVHGSRGNKCDNGGAQQRQHGV